MKVKDLINELSNLNEDTEVFIRNEDGFEKKDIKIDTTRKFFLDGKTQTVIRLCGSDTDKNSYIF